MIDEQDDLSLWAAREVLRLAEEDYRRGVRFWADPELARSVRDLMKEVVAGPGRVQAPRGAVFRSEPIERAAPRVPAIRPVPSEVPRASAQSSRPNDPKPPSVSSSELGASSSALGEESTTRPSGPAAKRPSWGPPPIATGRDADWAEQLAALKAEASGCMKCGLCQTRTQVVFAGGNGTVPLVFVGEAPGADEDRQGFPFVGRAGQLLTKIIEAIGLDREQVYIANVLKCRPPENRNPLPEEMLQCGPYLERQLALLRPKAICTLGLFATQYLLQTTMPIGKLRGQWSEYKGIPVLPTYHPAALLRNPALKATVWEDVQLLRRKLDE